VLRSQDGDVSHAPAFLGRKSTRAEAPPAEAAPAAPTAEDGEAPAKPKRRRAPRSFEAPEEA